MSTDGWITNAAQSCFRLSSQSPGVKRLVPARSLEEDAAELFETTLSTLLDSEGVMDSLTPRSLEYGWSHTDGGCVC